ncbi:MAG TPA: hypothetical protein VFC19_34190 [Candidatus Limnocylindrales bacterium]|nr:hypothetical protein [Candidatus Limnocylindrales bacterium]
MNIFKRRRSRTADQLSNGRGDRRQAASHSREMVLADPMTSVALRSLR